VPQELIIGTPISQFALHSAFWHSLHSSISKEQHEKYLCNPSSHNRKYGEYVHETRAPKINYWKTHKIARFVLSYVLSVTQQYRQRTAWKATLQSIQPLRKIRRIYSWNVHPISQYVKAITSQFKQCRTWHSKQGIRSTRSTSSIFMSCTEAIPCLLQIITLRGCKEKDGRSRGYKGSTLMQAL